MSNPILEKIDEFGEAVVAMRKANDESLAEMKKGNETRAKELEIQSDRANKKIDEALKEIKNLRDQNESYRTRVEILEALNERPRGTPGEQIEKKHLQAWVKYVRSGMSDSSLEHEVKSLEKQLIEMKVDSVLQGTALVGGNALPRIISAAIEELILKNSEIVSNVNNVSSSTGDYNELVTIHGANGGWSSETGTRSQSNAPNIRKVTITHGELYAFPRASNWALNDLMFNVENWLTDDAAKTMAVSLATAIYSGDGSAKPTGMVNSAPTATDDYASPMRAAAVYEYIANTAASPVTGIVADSLIDLQVSLRQGYQSGAKFAMNSVTQGRVRKLKIVATGAYAWEPNYQVGQPSSLLGKPIITWEDIPNVGSGLSVAYGDFNRAYTLAKIGPMTMIRDNVTVPGFTNFLISQRYGGIPRNNDAVKWLKGVAS